MRFGQYLEETQIPEWKTAYIDYQGLKKRISVIKNAQQGLNLQRFPVYHAEQGHSPPPTPVPSIASFRLDDQSIDQRDNSVNVLTSGSSENATESTEVLDDFYSDLPTLPKAVHDPTSLHRIGSSYLLPSLQRKDTKSSRILGTNPRSGSINPLGDTPLHQLLAQMTQYELSFITMLDAQLDKVDSFFAAREKEMLARGHLLQIQLKELDSHRKLFRGSHGSSSSFGFAGFSANWTTWLGISAKTVKGPATNRGRQILKKAPSVLKKPRKNAETHILFPYNSPSEFSNSFPICTGKQKCADYESTDALSRDSTPSGNSRCSATRSTQPDNYLHAKRKLKRAVLQFYHGLEVLQNYQALNRTGFQKALKKFEKVTKLPAQHQYMTEKVDHSAFASDKTIQEMMIRMEEMYSSAFARGDKKQAIERLRSGTIKKTHHFSTFRSGLFLGLAIPALLDGVIKVSQPETQEAIPFWNILLYLYAMVLIPVIFSLLISVNLLVWATSRINYVFIFEFDVITRMDHRQYLETPSLIFLALCYAFWASFSQIGAPRINPSWWLCIWLTFAMVIICNPLPLLFRPSRFWLLKSTGALFMSGTRRVVFRDFWLADQFCSLSFPIANIFVLSCVYVEGFPDDWTTCGSSPYHWPVVFGIATIPVFIRFVQSIKRYLDIGRKSHLVNAGKYASTILASLFYYLWRYEATYHSKWFILCCVFNTWNSIYAGGWDLVMDWSLFRRNSRHFLLRDNLAYPDHIYMYYFAMISNSLAKLTWLIYIAPITLDMTFRSLIVAFIEILRRWQWNFYRLENEHLGNMDQYRVTHEVPLPYSFDEMLREEANDDDDRCFKFKP